VTGPESTGKSWLAEHLAARYKTLWVPEYSPEYLRGLGRRYTYDDILAIARGQYRQEEKLAKKAEGLLFCDTDFLVNKIWAIDKFGRCHPWISSMAAGHIYHLYLLCNTDIPWEYAPLRENPHDRERLFDLYLHELRSAGLPYAIVSGNGPDRLENAVEVIENSLRSK
jgi:NadR type nicotinamide-nucleotide adenylyltransferase